MAQQAYVGRQPVYDRDLKVVGYELLFRPGDAMPSLTGEQMTSQVMVNTFIEFGLDNIVGDKLAFVNMTRPFLTGELPIPFPKERTVLEVLEDIVADPPLLAAVRKLADEGYAIALDDFAFRDHNLGLLEHASMVKIDVRAWGLEPLAPLVARARAVGAEVVAEKVETPAELQYCLALGFDYFQGYALSRPEIVEGTGLDPSKLVCLELIGQLAQPDVDIAQIDRLVRLDPALTYRVMRVANGASMALSRPIRTVREAVMLLGLRQLQSWVLLMVIAQSEDVSVDLVQTSMTRARMCELLARQMSKVNPDAAFTVGILSMLDVMLAAPLDEVLARLPLHDDLLDALLGHHGPLGRVLEIAIAYEHDRLPPMLPHDVAVIPLGQTYLGALSWAIETCRVMT